VDQDKQKKDEELKKQEEGAQESITKHSGSIALPEDPLLVVYLCAGSVHHRWWADGKTPRTAKISFSGEITIELE
jgi:hypothetical protein